MKQRLGCFFQLIGFLLLVVGSCRFWQFIMEAPYELRVPLIIGGCVVFFSTLMGLAEDGGR